MNRIRKTGNWNLGMVLGWVGIGGLIGSTLLAGCGGGGAKLPLAPVSGKVTLDGNPVPRGIVTFIPDESKGTKGPTAVGQIGPDGRFTLQSAQQPGAVIGHHKVRIRARQEAKTPQEEGKELPLIPTKYENENTSGLTAEVKSGPNEINFDLRSQ